jgi:hypothetical protein
MPRGNPGKIRTGSKYTADYLLTNSLRGEGNGYTVSGYLMTQRKSNLHNVVTLTRHLEHLKDKGKVFVGKSMKERDAYYPVEPMTDEFPRWIWER